MFRRYFPLSVIIQLVAIFVPIILNLDIPISNEIENGVRAALESNQFKLILCSCMSLSVPLLLEIFRDGLLSGSKLIAYDNLASNTLLVLVLVMPDMIFYFCVIPQQNIVLFVCIHQARIIAILSVVYGHLYIYGGHFFKQTKCSVWYILGCIGNHIFLWQTFYSDPKAITSYITLILTFLACFSYGLVAFQWLLNQYNVLSTKVRIISTEEYICNVYIISSILSFTTITTIWISYGMPDLCRFTINVLIGQNIAFGIFYVLISVFHQGLVRRDLIVQVR